MEFYWDVRPPSIAIMVPVTNEALIESILYLPLRLSTDMA
jgi:hypothetical protein